MAADVGGRGQDVAAGGAEVQVMAGQVAVALAGAGEVGVQAAAGGADVGAGAGQQPGAAEPGVGGEPGAVRAVLVDVQDVGAGGAGGDGQVPAGSRPNQSVICCSSVVASRKPCGGGGDLLPGQAGEHRPAAAGVGERLAERGVGHGALRAGVPGRVWPQWEVSSRSWPARAGRMRAWYSAWADSSAGVRSGWR